MRRPRLRPDRYTIDTHFLSTIIDPYICPLSSLGFFCIHSLLKVQRNNVACCNVIRYLYPAGSTYSCLAIAAERYLGICHPYDADSWYRKFRFFLFGIVAACLLIDLPRYGHRGVTP